MVKILLIGVIILIFAASGGISTHPAGGPADSHLLVVTLDRGASFAQVVPRLQSQGFAVRSQISDLHAVEVGVGGRDTSWAVRRLRGVPGVRYAEPVVRVATADMPPDPLFGEQYPYLAAEQAPAAWDIEQGQPNIVVAVVDTGIDLRHPNLQPNVWVNPREIPNNGIDDDGNGCIDDVNGCSFVSDSSPGCQNAANGYVNDDIGHGTFVAGVIAAAANNTGMVGVARNVRVMAVKVLDCHGEGDSVATARGILYAAHNGARVINLSLGGLQDAQVVTDAINEAVREGVLVVAATGNGGTATVAFPARLPNVLAVGATSRSDPGQRAPFSNWGTGIGVVAVGQDIIGPIPPSRCNVFLPCLSAGAYASGDGTSFAAPQVSGLAALMLSLNPSLTPAQLTNLIEESATALPPGSTPGWAGAGRINMLAALTAVQGNRPPGDPCTVATVIDGESFTCTDGRRVRMLQMSAPVGGQCGADWAKAALQVFFLPPGRQVYLRYDVTRTDAAGDTLAAPLWRGPDGADYNLPMVMVYVGLAHAADVGTNNVLFHDWAEGAQRWATAAQWNMWAPGKPFTGVC